MTRKVKNLNELLEALHDKEVLRYVDCGSYATLYFDQQTGDFPDNIPKAEDIRFLDSVDYQSDWQVEVETGMCGSIVDVYISREDKSKYSDDDVPF
jgi:hypothetical protein